MIKPQIFLSYARTDREAADSLYVQLSENGCSVWMDRNELIVGDDFVRNLSKEVERCDALVFLLSFASAASSWCLAELQRALGRGLLIIVIQQDAECRLPDAVERLLRDVQRISRSEASSGLVTQIHRARWRARRRLLVRASVSIGSIGVIAGIGLLSARGINRLDTQRRIDQFVAELRTAAAVWSGDEVRTRLRPIRDEPSLAEALRAISDDAAQGPITRVNSWQALDALREGRQNEWRTYVPQIDWRGGRLADTLWVNTTYGIGRISDLSVARVRMAGLVFGPGPEPNKEGLTLSGVRVQDADIWFLRMDGTQMIDVEFVNSKLRGAQLDLTGASALRFVSRPKSEVILSSDVAIFEDSWIVQNRPPPEPGVMDLAQPEHEMLFDGVQFARVRFEGHFKPDWFRKCHFANCVFSSRLQAPDLARGGNSEDGTIFQRQ